MLKKIRKPTALGMTYDPVTQDLVFLLDLAVYYNCKKRCFGVDQNPNGDPMLTTVSQIVCAQNSSKIEFNANFKGHPTQFEISLNSKLSREIATVLIKVAANDIRLTSHEDLVSILVEDGECTLRIVTYIDGNSRNHFSIYSDENGHFYVVQDPWQRFRLDRMTITGKVITVYSGDKKFERALVVSARLFELFKPLFNTVYNDILTG